MTEQAGREEAAAKQRAVAWENDPARTDLQASAGYDASQVLALAVSLGTPGEDSDVTTKRATAYQEWIKNNG